MSPLSSPQIPMPTATFVVRHRRGVRMPNELLREMAQCVPMEWFVGGGSSQAKQHRHSIGQLGTAMGTYLGSMHGKFAKVVAKMQMKLTLTSTSTAVSDMEEEEQKIRESIAGLSAEQRAEFLNKALEEELSVEQRVELQIKILAEVRAAKRRKLTASEAVSGTQQKADGEKRTSGEKKEVLDFAENVGKRRAGSEFGVAYSTVNYPLLTGAIKRRKMTKHTKEKQREEAKSGGGAGTAETATTDELTAAGLPSTSNSPRRRKCPNLTKAVEESCEDVDHGTLATSSSSQQNQQQDEGGKEAK